MQHLSDSSNLSEPRLAQSAVLLETSSWAGLKQQVLHLAQFGGSIQVVWGAEGSGKSTFLHLLLSEPEAALVAYHVPEDCSLETLFRALLHKLGLRPEADMQVGQLIAALRSHCQSLERSEFRAVVVLDDAHRLGSSELATVISILQGNVDSGFGLHLVLLAEPELLVRLDQLQLVDISIHDTPLPALSPTELNTMLAQYQQAYNWPPLSTEQLQRFWSQSGGLPGVALQLAVKQTKPSVQTPLWSLNGWPVGHFAALAFLCFLLVWALLVRQGPDAPEPVEDAAPTESRPVIRSEPSGRQSTPAMADSEEQVALSLETEVQEESLPVNRDSSDDASNTSPDTSSPPSNEEIVRLGVNLDTNREVGHEMDADTDLKIDQSGSAPQGSARREEDVVVEAESTPGRVEPAPRQTQQPEATQGVARPADAWLADSVAKLRAMPAQGYVLQLMATADLTAMHHFVTRQSNQEHLLGYTTARNGQPLHILVEGFYADRESASAAMTNLPAEQRRGGPWPKRIDAVHREMR